MANTPNIPDAQLKAILAEVELELQDFAKNELGILAKADDEASSASSALSPDEGSSASAGGFPGADGESEEDGAPGSDGGSAGPDGGPGGPPMGDDSLPGGSGAGPDAGPDAGAPPGAGMPPGAPPSAYLPPGAGAPSAGPDDVPPDEQGVVDASAAPDHDALVAEMSQLPPQHLMAVYLASKAALMQGQAAPSAPSAGPDAVSSADAPPAGPSAPGPLAQSEVSGTDHNAPEGSAGKNKVVKGEVKLASKGVAGVGDNRNGALKSEVSAAGSGGQVKVGKSEEDMDNEKLQKAEAEITDLKAQVDLLAQVVDKALGTPIRKAITSASQVAFIDKGGSANAGSPMSKSELTTKISELTCDPVRLGKLTKAERELVLASFEHGNTVDNAALQKLIQ